MYANLKVTMTAESGEEREVFAHAVTVHPDRTVIEVDRQDGTGSYAEPGGEVEIPHEWGEVRISASF